MERQTFFADIILPLPLPGYFTYRVPSEMNEIVTPGMRVVVPFGSKKIYSGIIRRLHQIPPKNFQARYISSILDEKPLVFEKQFVFWEWIAEYYFSTVGEVMNSALPPAMKLASETKVVLNPDFDRDYQNLNEKEYLIVEALEIQNTLTISEVSKISGLQKVFNLIKNLREKSAILLKEELDNPYREKVEKFLRLSPYYQEEEKLKEAFDYAEKKAPKQLEVLIALLKLSGRYQTEMVKEVSYKKISEQIKNAGPAIKALMDKGIFETYKKKVSRFDHLDGKATEIKFNKYQQTALDEIKKCWLEKDVVLLHGVTSSGKTEIYIQLIKEALERGEQVLYLLPEIALTTQIVKRIQAHFGDKAGVYHSRFNPMERTEVWNNIALGGIDSLAKRISYKLIVGPRSALFLPFTRLGLIIVDEEHEPSFKQYDPAPRYHARDSAVWLARSFGAKVLLGSATPSIESYYNAQTGKYALVELLRRHGGVQMPEILVADLKKDTRQKRMKSHFSPLLVENIKQALEEKKQIILFQNRRGFSIRLECDQCNWIPMCTQCDVSLVYHKRINKLKCHYCGYNITPPNQCPSCSSTGVSMKGFGTEKVEEELPLLFPAAKVMRMDLDTTRAKNAYQRIIQEFEEKKIDILIGTQMVSKGLDFENVGVVGILSADSILGFPDFRAHERGFQMMAQVSGRAGRNTERGKVIIQAFDPYHTIIRQVIDNNYLEMYNQQALERRNFFYPPFYRLVLLSLIHKDPQKLNEGSAHLASEIRKTLPREWVLGPEYPMVARIKNMYIKDILVKIPINSNFTERKHELRKLLDAFTIHPGYKSLRLRINIDPY